MKDNEKYIEEFVKDIPFDPSDQKHRDALKERLLHAFPKHRLQPTVHTVPIWRIIMDKPLVKLTAAAVIAVAALSVVFLAEWTGTAYALGHTIKANHSVTYIRIRNFKPGEDEPKECWLEFDQDGQVKNVRVHIPEWDSADGAKVAVWKEKKAQVWLKSKNMLITIRDETLPAEILKFIEELDPKLAVERLHEQEAQGKVKIEIDQPSDKSQPIVVTATYLSDSPTPDRRRVLLVDQATKLVTAIKLYGLKDGRYEYLGWIEYYDYNQPIAAEVFVLDDVPADVLRVDQTTQEVGLVQGQLTDEEVAVEVVRQFFQALIDRDYAQAGRLLEGLPAEKMRQVFGAMKFVRIISIGEPLPHALTGGFRVPCTIEIEKNGKISQWQPRGPFVRQVEGQPGRWTISGGI